MNCKKRTICILISIVLVCGLRKTVLYAQSVWNVHLIQSTDYKEEYCGALRLGLLESAAFKDDNLDGLKKLVSASVVRVHCGDSVGSGIVVSLTEENVIIVSNTHLLQSDVKCKVDFLQGFSAIGNVVSYAAQSDMAFLCVPLEQIPKLNWEELRYVDLQAQYKNLNDGDIVVQIGSSKEIAGDYYVGDILDKECYMPVYGMEMIKTSARAYTGMSGGGLFDSKGHLIGMITGGEMLQENRNEGTEITYCIPLTDILQELVFIVEQY